MHVYLAAVVLSFSVSGLADQSESEREVTNEEPVGDLASPEQIAMQKELDMKSRMGMIFGPLIQSEVKGTFDGEEKLAFSSRNIVIRPEQKGLSGQGGWIRNNMSEFLVTYHYGGSLKFYLISESGVFEEGVLGNPLQTEGAKVSALMPRATYATLRSLPHQPFTLISVTAIPAWSFHDEMNLKNEEMIAKFPNLKGMISIM